MSSTSLFVCLFVDSFLQYVFYGDDLPPAGSNVLLLSNHQCSGELQYALVV